MKKIYISNDISDDLHPQVSRLAADFFGVAVDHIKVSASIYSADAIFIPCHYIIAEAPAVAERMKEGTPVLRCSPGLEGVALATTQSNPTHIPETILQEAQRIVHGDRNVDYGHPAEDFTRVGRIWGALLGVPDIAPGKVALMMVGLKMSRECNREKRDNLVDGAGYFETASMVKEYLQTHQDPNPNRSSED